MTHAQDGLPQRDKRALHPRHHSGLLLSKAYDALVHRLEVSVEPRESYNEHG